MYYCNVCQRNTNLKRHFGLMTVVGVLITLGWWLLALPFYSKKCVFCKSNNYKKVK